MELNVLVMHLEKEDMSVIRLTGMSNSLVHGIQILARLRYKIFLIDLEDQMLFGLEPIVRVIP